jgi:hypothetical protein
MFIIVKNDLIKKQKEVVNIIYGDKYNSWVKEYLSDMLESYTNSINYTINDENMSIIKTESIIEKGYLYNNKTTCETVVMFLDVLEYNPKLLEFNKSSSDGRLWENLNYEINHRVLKKLDKDSLYQIFVELDKNMKLKSKWTSVDYINVLNELLKNFKKELYSSVAKKLKRFRSSEI